MACSYYTFRQNDYYCCKKGDYVNEDVYSRYCKGYYYDDCPIYKNEESGGCFITSACLGTLGWNDNCEELKIFRAFRDNYMLKNPKYRSDVDEYYKVAPSIVKAINSQCNFSEIYKNIYKNMLVPCLSAIKNAEVEKAYTIYKNEYLKLKEKFIK